MGWSLIVFGASYFITMHEAYEVFHLLNATVQIETIAAYGKSCSSTVFVVIYT